MVIEKHAVIVRPVSSVEELIVTEQVIADQFPARRFPVTDRRATAGARFESDRELLLVADDGGAIVGGALAHWTGHAVVVDVIGLQPAARRLGIGRQLMEAIERQAIRLGAQALYLGGANAENRGFYWRLGFAGRKSLMQKGLPLASRSAHERRRDIALDSSHDPSADGA